MASLATTSVFMAVLFSASDATSIVVRLEDELVYHFGDQIISEDAKRADFESSKNNRAFGRLRKQYHVQARILTGDKLTLPVSRNGYLTCENGKMKRVDELDDLRIVRSEQYLVALVSRKLQRTSRVYTVDLVIDGGPLSGAVIHVTDGTVPSSLKDPLLAVFTIPEGFVVEEGVLEFHLVQVVMK